MNPHSKNIARMYQQVLISWHAVKPENSRRRAATGQCATAATARSQPFLSFVLPGLALLAGILAPNCVAQSKHRKSAAAASLPHLDDIVNNAVAHDEIPGAVLLVSHDGRVVHRRAYG